MSAARKIAKNTFVLLISQIIIYALAFVYNIYMARYLGVEGFGILSFALAFTGIFSVVADLGLSTLTTRDVSRNKSLSNKYLINITCIKIFLVIIMLFLVWTSVTLLNYPTEIKYVIYVITFSVIIGNFTMVLSSIFQAHEKMEYQAISQALVSILIFLGVIFAINANYDVLGFAYIYLITNLIALIFNFSIYLLKFKCKIKLNIDFKFCIKTLKIAIPLSLAVIFSNIAFRIDSVMLSLIVNNIAVGWYTASYKLMESLLFIPYVFSIAILPVFSRFYTSSSESLKSSYEKSFKFLSLFAIPIAVGTSILSNEIILFIYGNEFSNSVLALKILIWAIPFIFLSYVLKVLLVSINKQNLLLKIIIMSLVVNVVLNVLLIPTFSYIGASIVTVITEIVSFIFCFYYLSIFIGKFEIRNFLLKLTLASLLMGFFLSILKINLLVLILISILIYIGSLYLLRAFSKDDLKLLKQALNNYKS